MTHDEPMRSLFRRDEDRLEQPRKEHPDWNIWSVPRVHGPATWHAQPSRYPLHAATAGELEEYIAGDTGPAVDSLHTSYGC